MHQHAYLNAFRSIPVNNKTIALLVRHFGSAEAAWQADTKALGACPGLKPEAIERVVVGRQTIDVSKEWEKLERENIRIITRKDPDFPSLLKEIPDAPYLLYVRGVYDFSTDSPLIAIVGSRKFTSYGEQAAYRLATDLSAAGFVVVSGLAFGIDSIAHKAALEIGCETLAVMGNGLADRFLYPRNHVPLAKAIERRGALISEYAPETKAETYTFPERNRIVAGLCHGTIVIEAAEESGTLITARLALEYDREVFAVPGPIFSPMSVGTNRLIRSGAKCVTSVQDILEEFPALSERLARSKRNPQEQTVTTSEEDRLLSTLSHEPLHVDQIAKIVKLNAASTGSLLAMMEIKGIVRNIGGMHYIRIS